LQTARSTAPRDPDAALDGLLTILGGLADLGVSVRYTELPHDVAAYDGDTATVHLRRGAPLEDLIWGAGQMWQLLAVGPAASVAVPRKRPLYAVPG
jgi:hypothetical protein